MEQTFLLQNDQSRAHLQSLVESLTADDFARPLPNGWSVAVTLAHLAFWDHWVVSRWEYYDTHGVLQDLPENIVDLVNESSGPIWHGVEPRHAMEIAIAAAEMVDARIAQLDAAAVGHAVQTGRPTTLDRSLHRTPHLDEIEAVRHRSS